ncbi:hypothetical protein CXF68_17835 [Tenacibaculum sp. Bg11-29]|uniref:hypothetical protein n=1 Tax=Tenacibaculum sp. Bg11-29 TaxID=2058306 RepID=UPI000C33EA88|nr:hypothetical protein [Tenacibaculum sp. Bg11-29]PKH52438.1 hypothetical protein CXF68_17835 [Tenacibaculum sp. Bg11-29]
MNKSTNNNANKTQKRKVLFSTIGVYNQEVKDCLSTRKLDAILQHTIKNFIDNAYRNKLTNTQYNKAVEEFNTAHGLLLLKRGNEHENEQKQYTYINYPYLDRQAVKGTMDKYRQYVFTYNEKTDVENDEIRKYNNTIVKNHFQLSETQKKRKAVFQKQNKKEFSRNYNELVIEENKENAIIQKKAIQKIKYSSELVFHVLVGFYVSQLRTRNAYLLEMNKSTSTLKNSLPKLKIDHRKLATHTIADIPRLSICKKTAQNHIKRLREANILINYLRINQNKPISVNFNSQIIEVLEGNPPKSQLIQNKSFNSLIEKSLHDNNDTTRTKILKEKEIKDCANSTALNKCGSMLVNENESNTERLAGGYKNTKGISNEKQNSFGGEKKIKLPDFLNKTPKPIKTTNQLTNNFLNKLKDDQTLAKKLAAGEYDHYKGERYDYLLKIVQYGLLSTEDFKQVILQDFIKSSAKIWKKHNVYVGDWKNTINRLKDQMFVNMVNKETVINKLKEYRWKLEFARNWFLKKEEVNALFPFAYFDKTRTKSNELGFYGLHSVWKSHLKYKEQKNTDKKQEQQDSNARKRRLSAQKKLTRAISKYELGTYNQEQLFNYVQDNLPHEYLLLLPNLIKNQNTNLA